MKLPKRILPLSVLTVVASSGFVFGLACNAPAFDKDQSFINTACQTDNDCPIYLTCHASLCAMRCSGEASYCGYSGSVELTCQSGACLAAPSSTSTSGTSGGTSGGPASTSCTVGGETVRGGITASPYSSGSLAANVALDDGYLYVSQSGTDSLGNPQSTIDAYPLAGGAATNMVTNTNSFPSPIFRSGSWLYLTTMASGTAISRMPAPPTGSVSPAPTAIDLPSPNPAAVTPTAFYVNSYGGSLVRVDGETGEPDSSPVGYASRIALTDDRLYFTAVVPSDQAAEDGGALPTYTGPQTNEIAWAPFAGGATTSTGVIVPDYTQNFYVAGTKAFITSLNQSLLSIDMTTAGAAPQMVHGPGLGTVYSDGTALLTTELVSSNECTQLDRIDGTTGATTAVGYLTDTYAGGGANIVGLRGGYLYWVVNSQLRRVKY